MKLATNELEFHRPIECRLIAWTMAHWYIYLFIYLFIIDILHEVQQLSE